MGNKQMIIPVVMFFLLVSGSAIFSEPNFPAEIRIFEVYGFEIKYNDTSVEKCYLTIYNAGDEIVTYYHPFPRSCIARYEDPFIFTGGISYLCSPAELYLESDGTLRYQFKIDAESFVTDEDYHAVVSCGIESYNATFTARAGTIPNKFFNWTLFGISNVELIGIAISFILILILIYATYRWYWEG